ncbi:MAG: hypothetical protein RLO80_12330 [Hyphomonas sp.]
MTDKYSAAEPYLGYLYQGRYALLRALQASKKTPSLSISIEKFDDVSLEENNVAVELIQTKHHCTPGDVGDFSTDLWKTLNIWIDRFNADPNAAADIKFVLLTTSTAKEDSALYQLRESVGERNEAIALTKLEAVATSSTSKATAESRKKFMALSSAQRTLLISSIWVFDAAPDILDVKADIEDLLHFAASGNASTLVSYLEGWWFDRVIQALTGAASNSIPLNTIEKKVFELSEGFKFGSLPLDEEIDAMTSGPALGDERIFVRQLTFVEVSSATRDAAIRDYYRAYTQRSRWARENLLLDGETERYDRCLSEDWGHEYAALCEDTKDGSEETKSIKGRELLRWSLRYNRAFRGRDERWLASGSFQILSDLAKIGWHPDYQTKLAITEED